MTISFAITTIAMDQLVQDKICLLDYQQSIQECITLSESKSNPFKLPVLADRNTFNFKYSLLDMIPATIWTLLIGSICDSFPRTKKYFLISTSGSIMIENTLVLINLIFFNEMGKF